MPLTNSRKDWEQAPDCNVSARLYKLLLYEPGDFFARHRDTERMNGMFGTLVIELPCVPTRVLSSPFGRP